MTEAVFGFVRVILGAVITWLREWCSSKQNRERQARYLAVRVVCILDSYVKQCRDVARDDGFPEEPTAGQHELPKAQVPDPSPPAYPTDADWQSVDQDLMYRALSLPNEVEIATDCIKSAFEHDWADGGIEERQLRYAELGLLAHNLAADFRKKYDIPQMSTERSNPEAALQAQKTEIEESRAESRTKSRIMPAPPPASQTPDDKEAI